MGSVSDQSNPRCFLAAGLFITASRAFFIFDFIPWNLISISVSVTLMWCLMFANGQLQGMGWSAFGSTMVYWWATKERGIVVAV